MKSKKFGLSVVALTMFFAPALPAKKTATPIELKQIVKNYLVQTKAKDVFYSSQPYVESVDVNDVKHELKIHVSASFSSQEFSNSSVKYYYKRLAKALPRPYNKYSIEIITTGMPIERLVPGSCVAGSDKYSAPWGNIDYDGAPWVSNESKPFFVSHGLFDRHISVWASHGRYYDQDKGSWKWQRPNLFCTTEDLFTQTIVVPYLIPMLENSGAIVFTPRERDWQTNEVIVDNDMPGKSYIEKNGKERWLTTDLPGFAKTKSVYRDGDNPFMAGTVRKVKAIKKGNYSLVSYQPQITKAGRYAVYVSYQTLPNSVSDAKYVVIHKGVQTTFHVNQQMGGSTWVYLGTFDFDKNDVDNNRVVINNMSSERGVVTTDAVRFGGGMGNIERGNSLSGLPRCLEGARYTAQWSGAPYNVYSSKKGTNDYADDINVRSNMTNWLAGGSVYLPATEGKNVPIELALAIHSDAGYSYTPDSIIGSLSICTTKFNDGRLASGVSRLMSRDLADTLLTSITRDLSAKYKKWTRRWIWDRNYSETRKPEIPSAIVETMSHQNFADMRRGLDPNFRFSLARSLYKGILRFVNDSHSRACVVQPLPVDNFRVQCVDNDNVKLTWLPVKDELEPTAIPTSYCVYVAEQNKGFDNGRIVNSSSYTFKVKRGVVYKFRVTAINRGGESFPSTTLAAFVSLREGAKNVVVVDGFKRLAAPAVVYNEKSQGFDITKDIGVSYGITAGWNGAQQCFDKSKAGSEGPGALGFSGDELAGSFVMGNANDNSVRHVEAIANTGEYNVSSCSVEAVENNFLELNNYDATDFVFGLQCDDGYSLKHYKTFSNLLRQRIVSYTQSGGRLLVSGAYVGTDMRMDEERNFLRTQFKCASDASNTNTKDIAVSGLGLNFSIIRHPNDVHYAAQSVDVLDPVGNAFCAMRYADGSDAAVAYKGNDYRTFIAGFPLDCVNENRYFGLLMKGIMSFLLND